jgi:hypothetical protein
MNRLQQQCAPPCAAQRGSTRHYLWVMSQPIAVSSRLAGLKHAGHDQSPVPAIAPRLPPSQQLRRVSFPNPFPTSSADVYQTRISRFWSPPSFVVSCFWMSRHRGYVFELYRGQHAEAAVTPSPLVEDLRGNRRCPQTAVEAVSESPETASSHRCFSGRADRI